MIASSTNSVISGSPSNVQYCAVSSVTGAGSETQDEGTAIAGSATVPRAMGVVHPANARDNPAITAACLCNPSPFFVQDGHKDLSDEGNTFFS